MKPNGLNLFPLLLLASIAALSCRGQAFLTNGLVAYYPFNGNANDESGNSNNGAIHGATFCADRFGQTNAALNFDGLSCYIGFDSIPLNQTDNWSISAWINPASLNQFSEVVCLGFDDGNSGDGFEFGMSQDHYNPGNELWGVLGDVTWIDGGYTFPLANVWYHIVMLRRDGITQFYVDGIETPNSDPSSPLTPSTFTIGSATGTRFFNGAIDDVRIYNHALSDAEVQELYQIESPGGGAPRLDIKKAVYLTFTSLNVGYYYQLQVSTNLTDWTDFGSPFFSATNTMTLTNYWNVDDWNQLFFRLH
jgi:hypothetical protein